MSYSKRFKVAVCGGGIGGLTFALALSKYPDIDVDIYEAATQFGDLGAGIGIFPRPWRIMKMLGLETDLHKLTESKIKDGPVPAFNYRKSDQPEGLKFWTLMTNGNLLTFHRADFQQLLLKRLPKSYRTYCSKRLRSYTQRQSGPIELVFEDGTTAVCDMLVGADGLKSSVRRSMLSERAQWAQAQGRRQDAADILSCIEPTWSGTIAYRALIPAERLKATAPGHRVLTQPTQYLGKHGYIIAYPISKGKLVNFVAFVTRHELENTKFQGPWVSTCDRSVFAGVFAHWEPEVQMLISCVEKPLQWAIHTVKPLRSFASGRVALIGDAAHGQLPHQGSGAGTAIEDAYLLATVLGHRRTTRETIHRALRVYDDIRRPAAHRVAEKSRLNGRYFTFEVDGMNLDRLSDAQIWERLQQLGSTFTRNWEWAWTTSVDGSLQDAIKMMES